MSDMYFVQIQLYLAIYRPALPPIPIILNISPKFGMLPPMPGRPPRPPRPLFICPIIPGVMIDKLAHDHQSETHFASLPYQIGHLLDPASWLSSSPAYHHRSLTAVAFVAASLEALRARREGSNPAKMTRSSTHLHRLNLCRGRHAVGSTTTPPCCALHLLHCL